MSIVEGLQNRLMPVYGKYVALAQVAHEVQTGRVPELHVPTMDNATKTPLFAVAGIVLGTLSLTMSFQDTGAQADPVYDACGSHPNMPILHENGDIIQRSIPQDGQPNTVFYTSASDTLYDCADDPNANTNASPLGTLVPLSTAAPAITTQPTAQAPQPTAAPAENTVGIPVQPIATPGRIKGPYKDTCTHMANSPPDYRFEIDYPGANAWSSLPGNAVYTDNQIVFQPANGTPPIIFSCHTDTTMPPGYTEPVTTDVYQGDIPTTTATVNAVETPNPAATNTTETTTSGGFAPFVVGGSVLSVVFIGSFLVANLKRNPNPTKNPPVDADTTTVIHNGLMPPDYDKENYHNPYHHKTPYMKVIARSFVIITGPPEQKPPILYADGRYGRYLKDYEEAGELTEKILAARQLSLRMTSTEHPRTNERTFHYISDSTRISKKEWERQNKLSQTPIPQLPALKDYFKPLTMKDFSG